MEEKLKITEQLKNHMGDVVIRHGEAEKIYDPVRVDIEGSLTAPWDYLSGKREAKHLARQVDGSFKEVLVYNPEECRLQVYKAAGRILFVGNEKSSFSTRVDGSLSYNSDLTMLNINTPGAYYSRDMLIELCRRNRHRFADPQEAVDLIKGLREFTAKVTKMVENREEISGNVTNKYEAVVDKLNIKLGFKLNIPIYENTEKEVFSVDIGVDTSQNKIQFYLLSDELFELEEKVRDNYMNQEILKFEDWGCSIVYI